MKILCLCDAAVTLEQMAPMMELEKYGGEIVVFQDDFIKSREQFFEVMLKCEREGSDAVPHNEKILPLIKDADIVTTHLSMINAKVLQAAEKLKLVAVMRGGTENVREDICRERGIKIINAAWRSAHSVADFTVGMILAEMKNIARGHRDLMDGKWTRGFANSGHIRDLRRCTIGIVGCGNIGQRVIERLSGFGSAILVHDPFMSDAEVSGLGHVPASLETVLKKSDAVSLHLRLSEKTQNFISKKELGMMKKTAFIVNTSRAGIIDEAALLEALQNRTIGGAALDVFVNEPLGENHPLLKLDNVTLTPHVAGTSSDTIANSVEIIKDELEKILKAG